MTAPKDSYIHIRCMEDQKAVLKIKANRLHMSLTDYLIHAGICYQPSEEVMHSVDTFDALMNKPMKEVVND